MNSQKVTLKLNTPGVDPDNASVRVERKGGERHLVVEESTVDHGKYSSTATSVRLPAVAGGPTSKASFKHGVLTVTFERVHIPDRVNLEVEAD